MQKKQHQKDGVFDVLGNYFVHDARLILEKILSVTVHMVSGMVISNAFHLSTFIADVAIELGVLLITDENPDIRQLAI